MPETRRLPLWAGRTTALIGIVLVALSLRQAVAAISPILSEIDVDIPLSSIAIGVLGMLPPILFAASGFIAPPIARRLGLEQAVVLSIVLMVIGHLGRAIAPNYGVLVLASVVTLLGMGLGNVLLPPVVRRYFPDRIAVITSTYVGILALSTAAPALVATPLADSVGWRFSLGIWALTGVVAVIPWLVLLARQRAAAVSDVVESVAPTLVGQLWRSRVALAITLSFSASTVSLYACLAWLPQILEETAGSTQSEAGVLLALFSFVGLPGGIIAPLVVARVKNVAWILIAGVALFVIGFGGLALAPATATVLWVVCLGVGPIMFPVCLVLINSRTRTHEGAIALSGFVQGIGYTLGAFGPLGLGLLHDLTSGWVVPLLVLMAATLVSILGALALAEPRYVEDELARA